MNYLHNVNKDCVVYLHPNKSNKKICFVCTTETSIVLMLLSQTGMTSREPDLLFCLVHLITMVYVDI